jgi:hypothetical protein
MKSVIKLTFYQLSKNPLKYTPCLLCEQGKWKSVYGVDGSLCAEVMQHTLFCQQAAKCCPSIENVVNDLKT